MEGCNYLTITPISKDARSKGCIDYNEQEKRTSIYGYKWCWDDSQFNKAKVGEYFAFLFFEKRVIIHKIDNIKPPYRFMSYFEDINESEVEFYLSEIERFKKVVSRILN